MRSVAVGRPRSCSRVASSGASRRHGLRPRTRPRRRSTGTDPAAGCPWVALADLPPEAAQTLDLIDARRSLPLRRRTASTFENREGILPDQPTGYYREYTVRDPGLRRPRCPDGSWPATVESSTGPTTTTPRSRGSRGDPMSGLAALLAGRTPPGHLPLARRLRGRRRAPHRRARRLDLRLRRRRGTPRPSGVPARDREALDFPDWYGRNFDALADCLADVDDGDGTVLLWDGWGTLARDEPRAFSVALSVLGTRVNADRGGPFAVLLRGDGPDPGVRRWTEPVGFPGRPGNRSRRRVLAGVSARLADEAGRDGSDGAVGGGGGQLRSTARASSRTVGPVEGGQRQVDQVADDRLDLGVGAGVVDDPPQPRDLVGVEGGAEGAVEQRRVVGGRGVERERDQHGPLALDQVVAGGLAGRSRGRRRRRAGRRAAGRPRPAGARTPTARRACRGVGAGERGADVQRPLDGVLGGLVAQHGHRGLDVGAGRGPAPRRRGTARRSPRSGTGRTRRARARPAPAAARTGAAARRTSPAAGRRAGSPPAAPYCSGSPRQPSARCSVSNAAVGGGPAAAGVGGVHEVVVDQRAGVQQLERGARPQQRAGRPRGRARAARKPQ